MADSDRKENVSKVYCEKCNIVFDSRADYEKHYNKHDGSSSGIVYEACPLDTAVSKILGLFKKKTWNT